jgi:hypothetical protein
MVKETALEFFPLHEVMDVTPIPPETKTVPPDEGLKTKTSTVPGSAMSAAVTVATNWWLLVKVVTRKEPFQLTTELRSKSLPLTVSRNWLPPAAALLGEMEVMAGRGGQVPQERAVASVIASAAKTGDLALLAIGSHARQTADGN